MSSWLNFGRPAPMGRGLWRGEIFWLRLTTASVQCLHLLWALFFIYCVFTRQSSVLLLNMHVLCGQLTRAIALNQYSVELWKSSSLIVHILMRDQLTICNVNNCLRYLLPEQCYSRITNNLRTAKKYPIPFAKSTHFKNSFIPYALANFQWL